MLTSLFQSQFAGYNTGDHAAVFREWISTIHGKTKNNYDVDLKLQHSSTQNSKIGGKEQINKWNPILNVGLQLLPPT